MVASNDPADGREPQSAGEFNGQAEGPSIDPADVARFSAQAAEWWDARGPFAPLHRFNPARLAFVRDRAAERFGRDVRARPGTLVLTDLSRPAGWLLDAQRMTTLLVPRTLLGVGADGVATLTATPLTGELARLVSSLAHLAFRAEPVGRADATRLGSALVDLISVTLASHLGGPEDLGGDTPRRALLTRIYAFVEERLGDPDLTPRAVAAAHHISVRYLFRLFEGDGHTPAAWIRRRRLEHAHRDLLDPRLRDRPVGAIGARWGFTNPAHFNRAFKAQFGTSPGELRNR